MKKMNRKTSSLAFKKKSKTILLRTDQVVAFDMDSKMLDGRLGLLFKDNYKKPQIWFQVGAC